MSRPIDAVVARLERASPEARLGAAWWVHRQATRAGSLSAEDRDRLIAAVAEALTREPDARVRVALVATLAATDHPARARWLDAVRAASRQGALPPTLGLMALRAWGPDITRTEDLRTLVEQARAGGGVLSQGAQSEVLIRTLAELPPVWFHQLAGGGRLVAVEEFVVQRAIAARGDPRYAPRVRDALEAGVRSAGLSATPAALSTVESLGLVELAPLVLELARLGRDATTRRAAVRALGALGGGFDASALEALLSDPIAREPALDAIGRLGDAGRVPAVVPWLSAVAPGDRARAAQALGRIGDASALGALLDRASRELDVDVRSALYDAAGQIGGDAASEALGRIDDVSARVACVRAVMAGARPPRGVVRGDDEAAAWLRAAAGDAAVAAGEGGDVASRMAWARAQSARRDVDEPVVIEALRREPHESVRALLVLALGRAARRDPSGAASRALSRLLRDETDAATPTALAAWVAMTEAGVAADSSTWLRALAHRDPRMRQAAAWAAGRLGGASMRATLERALWSEPDPTVRGALAVALAAAVGEPAAEALAAASRSAWTPELIDRIAYAQALSRSSQRAVEGGDAVALRHGAPPGSVWAAELSDGGWRVAVATMEGDVLIPGAPSADTSVRRLDAR